MLRSQFVEDLPPILLYLDTSNLQKAIVFLSAEVPIWLCDKRWDMPLLLPFFTPLSDVSHPWELVYQILDLMR